MPEANHELQNEVAGLIVSPLNLDVSPDEIQPDASLYGDGLGLDSIDILEVALVVSKRFGFQLRADNADNVSIFSSLASLLWPTGRSPRRPAMLFLCAVVGGLLWGSWGMLERNFSWVYFLQHAGTYAMLAAVFGVTLGRGRQALCTRFAEAIHGSLAADEIPYSRPATL